MRSSAEVASAASVLIFLGEVVFGGETLNLYKSLAAREIESALLVLRENLDDYLIADIYNVLNLFRSLNVKARDMNKTFLARCNPGTISTNAPKLIRRVTIPL